MFHCCGKPCQSTHKRRTNQSEIHGKCHTRSEIKAVFKKILPTAQERCPQVGRVGNLLFNTLISSFSYSQCGSFFSAHFPSIHFHLFFFFKCRIEAKPISFENEGQRRTTVSHSHTQRLTHIHKHKHKHKQRLQRLRLNHFFIRISGPFDDTRPNLMGSSQQVGKHTDDREVLK